MQISVIKLLVSVVAVSTFASSGAFAQHHGGGGGGGGGGRGGGSGGGSRGGSNGGQKPSRPSKPPQNGSGRGNSGGQSGATRGSANVGHGQLKGEKTVKINNQKFVQRTYVNNRGGRVNVTLAPRHWGGRPYYAYYHTWGFHPAFWGVYWGAWSPFTWGWGWYGNPWYHDYWGWYFHPYPRYAGPAFWITDWVIADTLSDAYERGREEGIAESASSTSAPISDDVKNQLVTQVDETTKDYQAEKAVDIKDVLANPNYIFAVNETLSLAIVNGTTSCNLAGGDLVKIVNAPTEANPVATVSVVSSKFGSCPAATQVSMSVETLQEMLNAFSERVDSGLHEFEKEKIPDSSATTSTSVLP